MKTEGKKILVNFQKRWQLLLTLQVLLYCFGASILVYFLTQNLTVSLIIFSAIAIIASLFIKPWKPNLQSTTGYLDSKLESAEYSSSLLLSSSENLSNLAKLQKIKISKRLKENIKDIRPPNKVLQSAIIALLLILVGFITQQFNLINYLKHDKKPVVPENIIVFKTKDSTNLVSKSPSLIHQSVTIKYPEYTNVKSYTTSKMDVRVLEGSQVFWKIKFDSEIANVYMESMGNNHPMSLHKDFYRNSKTLTNSGFYNFKFEDNNSKIHSSDLYAIEVFKDKSPKVEIQGLKQFTSFNYDDEKVIQFTSNIDDDFGIGEAHIIATVSKGSGESVKFREEKIAFDNKLTKGLKKLILTKRINLKAMKMAPGDELYFYVEASDLRKPNKNTSRSETYFAAIKDTTSNEFGVESTLGVNRMPDYFRSQRQLIIDTEKLISDKKDLSLEVFKFRSNELGYDQKALRLKYGEFMGVETESGLDTQEASPEHEDHEEHEEHEENDDPLAEYTHNHDGDNDHNLVDTTDEKDKTAENPLQEFLHEHGDPEMATLFEESLKVKMHKAMSEMWDAELYLRLYEPKKSLPYQYKALELIQDIKNHARIYVHRIGFDPPPIKEDKRLTGKALDKAISFRKTESLKKEDELKSIKQSIIRLEELLNTKIVISKKDIELFEKAAIELSGLALEFPGKHLQTLQRLKRLIERLDDSKTTIFKVRQGLLLAIPKFEANPTKTTNFLNEIDALLIKELNLND